MSDATVAAELLTIGHSNLPADRFIALLTDAGVSAIVDVRSLPFSRWCPWFSSKALAARLAANGMAYVALGVALGGRPRDPKLYCDGIADYEAMAKQPEFRAGLARVVDETRPPSRLPALLRTRPAGLPPLSAGWPGPGRATISARPYSRRRQHRAACGDRAAIAQAGRRRSRSFSRPRRAPGGGLPASRPHRGGAAQRITLEYHITYRRPLCTSANP